MQRMAFWLVLGAVWMVTAAGAPVWAAEAAPSREAPLAWGVVDTARIESEYRGMQQLNQQFQDFQRGQELQLETRYKARLLDDGEKQEFLDLSQMGAPTEDRDKRLAELAGFSDQRERRLRELEQMKERTPGDEEEHQKLKALYDKRIEELNALKASIEQARLAKYQELSTVVTDSVNAAVKAVAEEKKLAVIFRKDAVLYAGAAVADVTGDVLSKLNAEPPAPVTK
jgi:Skp family chaperone for outer membrane proteins